MKTYNEFLTELFDNPYPTRELSDDDIEKLDPSDDDYVRKFQTKNGETFYVHIDGRLNIGTFMNSDGRFGITGEKGPEAAKIISTVLNVGKEYLIKKKPPELEFSAAEKSRSSLYKRIAQKYTPKEYTMKVAGRAGYTSFIMQRNNNLKEDTSNVTQQDLKDVSEWLGTSADNVKVELKKEPISKFEKQIKEMHGTYDEFPKDARRTNKILNQLKRGEEVLPIYVEKNDKHLFVMEGRHRMVAFWLNKMKEIPVAYVSKKNISEDYKGEHQAAGKEGAPLHDMTHNEVYPKDYYDRWHEYTHDEKDAALVVNGYRNKPNKLVTIYRAVPHNQTKEERLDALEKAQAMWLKRKKVYPEFQKEHQKLGDKKYYEWLGDEEEKVKKSNDKVENIDSINPGDWVTIVRNYAKEHGRDNLNNKFRILTKKVRAKDIFTDGNSLAEWGFAP